MWWQHGYANWTDKQFKKRLRVNRDTFHFILNNISDLITEVTKFKEPVGAIHSTKISRPRFENFVGTNGSRRRPVSFQSSVNVSQNGGCSDAFARVNGRRCQR